MYQVQSDHQSMAIKYYSIVYSLMSGQNLFWGTIKKPDWFIELFLLCLQDSVVFLNAIKKAGKELLTDKKPI